MARKPELCTVLLDVGTPMHPYLPLAGRGLATLAQTKMVAKPKDRMRVILFGTTATHNALHAQFEAQGVPQYLNITTAHELGPVTPDHLRTLHQAPPGEGSSDFIDALGVAMDALVTDLAGEGSSGGGRHRMILLSNFLSPHTKPDPTGQFLSPLVSTMQAHGVQLEVVSLDVAGDDAAGADAKALNRSLLDGVCMEVNHSVRSVRHPEELAALWKAHHYGPPHTSLAVLALEIGARMRIGVKLCYKARKETTPALGKETPLKLAEPSPPATQRSAGAPMAMEVPAELAAAVADAVAAVKVEDLMRAAETQEEAGAEAPVSGAREGLLTDREYYREDDPGHTQPIPDNERVKGYRYGKEVVPLLEEDAASAIYQVHKGCQLLGFLPATGIPRHYYMDSPIVMVSDKSKPEYGVAMAALTQALHRKGQVAVLRLVTREASTVSLFVAVPVVATAASPDHLLLNKLPFMEDVRSFAFATFDKDSKRPSAEQQAGMDKLVQSLTLVNGPLEELHPATTANPALHRFLGLMASRVVDPQAAVPAQDPLVDALVSLREDTAQGDARGAVAEVAALFPAQGAHATRGRAVHRLRRDHEVEDFNTMMEQDNCNEAVSALRKYVEAAVDSSSGEQRFGEAADAVVAMRVACVRAKQAHLFNSHLRSLGQRYAGDAAKGAFWRALAGRGVTLVSEGEVAGSEVSAQEGAAYLEKMAEGGA